MKHREPEPTLFDLPLASPRPPAAAGANAGAGPSELGEESSLPLVAPTSTAAEHGGPVLVPPRSVPQRTAPAAGFGRRLWAALANGVVQSAMLVLLVEGASWIAGEPGPAWVGPLALFVAIFSFFYAVIPLAFWGQTPGMAWAGIVARSPGGEALSFGQAARRWLGGWLTALLGGLPGLLLFSGRSLTDRLSGSRTLAAAADASRPERRAA